MERASSLTVLLPPRASPITQVPPGLCAAKHALAIPLSYDRSRDRDLRPSRKSRAVDKKSGWRTAALRAAAYAMRMGRPSASTAHLGSWVLRSATQAETTKPCNL